MTLLVLGMGFIIFYPIGIILVRAILPAGRFEPQLWIDTFTRAGPRHRGVQYLHPRGAHDGDLGAGGSCSSPG